MPVDFRRSPYLIHTVNVQILANAPELFSVLTFPNFLHLVVFLYANMQNAKRSVPVGLYLIISPGF
jgi:hypothetical protein